MSWKVYINGKDTGIVETNLEWATRYWKKRALMTTTGDIYELKKT